VQRGIVGSDPDILPYGTQIFVPNYGVGEVQDTGGARSMPLWVDLGYSDADYRGWYGYHDVYILTPVSPEIDYILQGT
jgi:3D (Asp-Asp-Asp) domain-containing protein